MNLRKKFSSQFIIVRIFLAFVIFSLGSGFIFQITKVKQYKLEIANLNKEINDTKLEINKMKKIENNHDLETDARNRLNMVKPGEIIYIDIDGR